jgi:hypothetical protein
MTVTLEKSVTVARRSGRALVYISGRQVRAARASTQQWRWAVHIFGRRVAQPDYF